jgi:quinoprotein glucose dehydrogenase
MAASAVRLVSALIIAGVPVMSLHVTALAAPEAPLYKTIPAAASAELTPANGWPSTDDYRRWTRSSGGPTSNRYSALTQINRDNARRLVMAWTYHSADGEANIQANPVAVGTRLFLPTAGNRIVALNAATGKEIWSYRPPKTGNGLQDIPARRGLIHWPGDGRTAARLFFSAGNWVYALDPENGMPVTGFGKDGRVELPTGGTATGTIWRHVLIVPGFLGDVFGYDVVSGKQLWRFHTMPTGTEFGAETWAPPDKGANCWGGMSLDESRGIAYIATGSPKPNYLGAAHLGANLFANCIIALKAETGERLWHFQEIEHDIWDLDLPTAPNLVTVTHDGRKVDAIAAVSKIGNTILLDRVTGKPLFPYRLRRAPASKLPGEITAPYQPDLELPQPFGRQDFSRDQITDRTPEARAFVERQLTNANMGWFEPFEDGKPTAFYGMLGGSDWPGACFDPATGRLYVAANHLPWLVAIQRDDDPPPLVPATAGEKVYQQYCAACHGAERRGSGMVPALRGVRHRMTEEAFLQVLKTGRGAMPPLGAAIPPDQVRELQSFLFVKDRPIIPPKPNEPPRYAFAWYKKILDQEGYPGIKPPWGSLNCIDLNSGRLLWRVPLGEHVELTKSGVPKTGTENMGGATVTAGGVVFCSGTKDNKIRAFSSADGEELWSATLPWNGTAPPAVYEVDGREFVVIAASGGGKTGGPTGDAWVAFALPRVE